MYNKKQIQKVCVIICVEAKFMCDAFIFFSSFFFFIFTCFAFGNHQKYGWDATGSFIFYCHHNATD